MRHAIEDLRGREARLFAHFAGALQLEEATRLDGVWGPQVPTGEGDIRETPIGDVEVSIVEPLDERAEFVPGGQFFDIVEAKRVQLAYAHDPNFAVSMSGVRCLPHEIVAVHRHMRPQSRLRFILADRPLLQRRFASSLGTIRSSLQRPVRRLARSAGRSSRISSIVFSIRSARL